MFCSNCGRQLSDRSKFCSGCGARILINAMPLEEYQRLTQASDAPAPQPPQTTRQPEPDNGYIPVRQSPVGVTCAKDVVHSIDQYTYVQFSAKNLIRRSIKYMILYIQAYNRVNDPIDDVLIFKHTGPFDYRQKVTKTPNYSWSDPSLSHFEIQKLEIEFMDGVKIQVEGKDVPPYKSPLLE